jgi:hypothetical protein
MGKNEKKLKLKSRMSLCYVVMPLEWGVSEISAPIGSTLGGCLFWERSTPWV